MEIWITEIGEPLPLEAGARRLRYGQMAPLWAQAGHNVMWWASNFSHAPRRHVARAGTYKVDGVTLNLLEGPGYQRSVSVDRLWHQRQVARRFRHAVRDLPPPDLILAPIPTIEMAREAIRYGTKHQVPVALDIRDEWPDEFARLAPAPLQGLARVAFTPWYRSLSKVARNAAGIVAITDRLRDYGLRFAGREVGPQDAVVSFGYDSQPLTPEARTEAEGFWREQGLDPSLFTLCFFGTIGRFFDFDDLIAAVKNLPQVQLVLCGDGSALGAVRDKIGDCPRILTPGWVGADAIRSLMEHSQVGVAPYREGTAMSLSNKPVEYFSGGLAVLASEVGELNRLLETHQCGLTVSNGDWRGAIESVLSSPERLAECQRNAKALFDERFEIGQVAHRMLGHLEKLTKTRSIRNPLHSLSPLPT